MSGNFCTNCGRSIEGESRFCGSCGSPYGGTTQSAIATGAAPQPGFATATATTGDPYGTMAVPQDGATGATAEEGPGSAMAIAIICSIIALVFLPPVFGGIAIWQANRLKKYEAEKGSAIRAFAILCTVAGMFIGALLFVA
jgi:hypothetical protein